MIRLAVGKRIALSAVSLLLLVAGCQGQAPEPAGKSDDGPVHSDSTPSETAPAETLREVTLEVTGMT